MRLRFEKLGLQALRVLTLPSELTDARASLQPEPDADATPSSKSGGCGSAVAAITKSVEP